MGFAFRCAGGHHRHPVGDHMVALAVGNGVLKLPTKPSTALTSAPRKTRMRSDASTSWIKSLTWVVISSFMKVVWSSLALPPRFCSRSMRDTANPCEAGTGPRSSRPVPRPPPGGLGNGQFGFKQRGKEHALGNGHFTNFLAFSVAFSGVLEWTQESWFRILAISNQMLVQSRIDQGLAGTAVHGFSESRPPPPPGSAPGSPGSLPGHLVLGVLGAGEQVLLPHRLPPGRVRA